MKRPNPISIELTDEQVAQLRAHYEYVESQLNEGKPGILAAQVGASQHGGHRFIRVGFVPHEAALTIMATAK